MNITGAANQQTINVNLLNVTANGAPATISVPKGLLLGDVNGTRVVTGADGNLTRAQQSQPVAGNNFRTDVNVTGVITGANVNQIKQKQNSFLP